MYIERTRRDERDKEEKIVIIDDKRFPHKFHQTNLMGVIGRFYIAPFKPNFTSVSELTIYNDI